MIGRKPSFMMVDILGVDDKRDHNTPLEDIKDEDNNEVFECKYDFYTRVCL